MGPRTHGDGASLEEIERVYRARLPEFRRVAAAIGGDRELALDAVQDAFALAVRKRASFSGQGSLEAWLWRIVVNATRDQRRRVRPTEALAAREPSAEQRAPRRDTRPRTRRAPAGVRAPAPDPVPSLLRRSRLRHDRRGSRDQHRNGGSHAALGARDPPATPGGGCSMTDRDPLGAALETLEPPFADEPVDWDDVLRRAAGESARAPRRRPRRLALAAVATAVAACVALVVSPFGGDRTPAWSIGRWRRSATGPCCTWSRAAPAWAARSSTSRAASAPSCGSSRRPGSIRTAASARRSAWAQPCSRSTARRRTGPCACGPRPGRWRSSAATTGTRCETAARECSGRARWPARRCTGSGWRWTPRLRRCPAAPAARARTWPSRARPTSRSTCASGRRDAASGRGCSNSRACRPAAGRSPGGRPR